MNLVEEDETNIAGRISPVLIAVGPGWNRHAAPELRQRAKRDWLVEALIPRPQREMDMCACRVPGAPCRSDLLALLNRPNFDPLKIRKII
jgi:hypothetical protein